MKAAKNISWFFVALSFKIALVLQLLDRSTIQSIESLRWILVLMSTMVSITLVAAAILSVVFLRSCRQFNSNFLKCLVTYSILDFCLAIFLGQIDKDLFSPINLKAVSSSVLWLGMMAVINAVILVLSLPLRAKLNAVDEAHRA